MKYKLKIPLSIKEFVYRLIRGVLYTFTFILCILGLSLVLFSFWYIYEGKNYHLDASMKFCVFTVAFVLGFVLLALSLCGLTSVFNENLFLAKIFLMGISTLMVVEISCIFLVYSYKHEILTHANTLFKKFISEYADDGDIRYLVDTIQSDLKCCGISSPNDWENNPYYKCSSISTYACSVPASCCYNFAIDKPKFNLFCGLNVRRNDTIAKSYQLIHVTGCKYSIYTFLDYKHKLASFVLLGILIPQVIGILLIVSFIVSLSYLIRYNSIDRDCRGNSLPSSNSSVLNEEFIAEIENKMYRSDSSSNITSHGSVSYTNKDVYFVNPKQNYLVTFEDRRDRDTNNNNNDNQKKIGKLQMRKQENSYVNKKTRDTMSQHDSKKNLFILSIGSNNEFIKRIQMSNANNTINE